MGGEERGAGGGGGGWIQSSWDHALQVGLQIMVSFLSFLNF